MHLNFSLARCCICHTIHPCKITDIAWDDKYIIAKQTEEKSIRITLTQQLQKKSEHYWIIDVKHNKRFGPYNEKQFNEQKDAFKIKVPFQNVDSYIKK